MLHKDILVGDGHIIHNWEVANTAARNALVVTAADKGKVAWQLDNNVFYFLSNNVGPVWLSALGTAGPAGANGLNGLNGTNGTNAPKILPIACSDEITALTTGAAKVTLRMPYAMVLSAVRASLTVAQTSGVLLTVSIKESGVSILSTALTFDNTEKTTTTAVTLPVISDANLADDAEITIDIDQIGDGTAKGLKVYLIGT